MKIVMTKPEHEVAYQDICALMRKHADSLTAVEMLAVTANMIGKMIALQDQRALSPEMALQIVMKNIEAGNAQVMEQLASSKGSA